MIRLGLQLSSLSRTVKHQPCRGLLQVLQFVHRHRQSADTPRQQRCPSMYQRARVAGICRVILRANRVVCAVQASSAVPLLRRSQRQPASTQRRCGRVAVSASLQTITASPLYSTWLQSAVVVVILGAVDAAYSGDWCSSHA